MTLQFSIPEKDLQEIKQFVKSTRGLDLSFFKPAFLSRRINVRMKMLNVTNGSSYVKLLNSDPNEVGLLYDSLSINVTKFYRDKQVWQIFATKVIPKFLEFVKPSDTIRIWSCGCSTGEEPYSLAILFNEAVKNKKNKIKILATDINSDSLRRARLGKYSSENLKNLDSVLITKYFKKIGSDLYQIKKEIKDLVTFTLSDITKFPASYMDVVFCRNLLIYYGKDAQELIIKKLYTVLKQNSLLVLGMDETLLGQKLQNSFIPIFPKNRIYQKKSATESLSELISGV